MVDHKIIDAFTCRDSNGSVIVEFAISFWVLLLFCFGLITFGGLLNDYLKVVQVADEAVRTLSSIPGLEADAVEWQQIDNQTRQSCRQNASANPRCGHVLAQSRVFFLAQALNLDPTSIDIVSELADDNVSVRIRLPISGVSSIFLRVPISVAAEGPYLF